MSTAAAVAWPQPKPSVPGDRLVLAGRPLRAGTELAGTSRYRDDVWDLGPAQLQKHLVGKVLDFTTLPAAYRVTAKQLFYAVLAGPWPEGERMLGPVTIRVAFTKLKIFTTWLATRGSPPLAKVTPDDIDAYRRAQAARQVSESWLFGLQQAIRHLWAYRNVLDDHLRFDPTGLDGWYAGRTIYGRSRENSTDRIPEAVLGPLLGWALRFVDELSGDILASRREWAELYARDFTRWKGHRDPGEKTVAPLAMAVLQRYRQAGRALPGIAVGRRARSATGVNLSHLAREIGCQRNSISETKIGRGALDAAIAELGIDDDAYLWTPMTATIGGRLWLPRMVYRLHKYHEQRLNTACYIVIAYLSGMRDSEVKHLRRGCLSVHRSADGTLSRYKLTSRAFKGESDPHGVEAAWVVGEPVARAVAIIEQLQPPEQQLLFAPLPSGHHFTRRRHGREHANEVLTSKATNQDIAGLIAWINDYCREHGLPDNIPDVAGQPPAVVTSQFRRTLAWFIARRPGGSIAGAIAYRHHTVQMFEGYAGTSESGFRPEVEAEQALARGEQLAVMVERHEHQRLSGPAAQQADLRLRELGQHLRFAGVVPTDRRQLHKLITRHDPHIYPGEFVTCVHNPEKALCHTGTRTTPALGDCQPLACRNVALTPENKHAWDQRKQDLDTALRHPEVLAPAVLERLRQRQDMIRKLLGEAE